MGVDTFFAVQGWFAHSTGCQELGFLVRADRLDSLISQSLWGREETKETARVTWWWSTFTCAFNAKSTNDAYWMLSKFSWDHSNHIIYFVMAKTRLGKFICQARLHNKAIQSALHNYFASCKCKNDMHDKIYLSLPL